MKTYTNQQLTGILRKTAPMLMLDIAQLSDDGVSAVGRKAVSMSEAVFQGHFPGQPILPGVLQVEAMAQLCRLIFQECLPGVGGTEIVMRHIRRLKFRKPVLPGMVMTVEAKLLERNAEGEAIFQVSCNTERGLSSAGTIVMAQITPDLYDHPRTIGEHAPHPFVAEMEGKQEFEVTQLMKLLPHRPPFLLLDKAVGIGTDCPDIYGFKNLSGNDMMLAGMAYSVYPFSLMIEAAAQLGCAHILSQPANAGKLGIFLCIDEAHFYQHAMIGDQLVIHGHCEAGGRAGGATGEMWVDDQKIVDCSLKFILMDSLN